MRKLLLAIIGIFTLISGLKCVHQSQSWASGMRGMSEAYTKLLPFIYDSRSFSDPKNEKFINLYMNQLNENAGSLSKHTAKGLSGDDPLFAVGLRGLKTTLEKATDSYYAESFEYSQNLLQTSLNYCNACHTRTSFGPTYITMDQFENLASQPDPLDKAKMLVATRQFPQAIKTLEAAITRRDVTPDDKQKALVRAVFISLKNLESPQKALELIKLFSTQNSVGSDQERLKTWTTYLKNWPKNELSQKTVRNKYLGTKRNTNPRHYIAAIYESMTLHKHLSRELEKRWRAKIYYRLGKIYQDNPSLGFWELPDAYYETCIHEFSRSKIALKCYYALEKMLSLETPMLGKGASKNLHKTRLGQLRSLAKPTNDGINLGSGEMGTEDF